MALKEFQLTARFVRDYKKLDTKLQERVDEVLKNDLVPWPVRQSLRHHTLSGYKPPIHVIDVTSNKAYQITFRVDGDRAILLRVASHREIDRAPA